MNLENHNFVLKNITNIKKKLNDGSIIQEPDNILKEIHTFYNKPYSKRDVIDIQESNFNNLVGKMPKLPETKKDKLEQAISLDELRSVVTNSKNNKSPGLDGFTNEFYKTFWPEIGNFLLDLMTFYKEQGELDDTQKAGIIICIPKGDKMRNQLKNWRPITLLISIYNYFSAILTKRIETVLDKIIHHDQKGFLNNRFIGENSRLTLDITREC